jgi:tetratricopeptide (TPR) repeat protein
VLPIPYEQTIAIARQHLKAGRTSQAEDLCRRILRDEPKRAGALHLLGLAASKAARHQQAIALLQEATTINSNFAEAFSDLGTALRHASQNEDAIAACRSAVELRPNVAEFHNNLGIAFADGGELDAAIASYLRAIELKPDLANAHYNLANAFRNQDRFDEAVEAYQQAIRLRPDFHEAHNNLGDALKASGKVSAAIAAYDRAIEISPDRPEPHWNRALALLTQGDFERGWAEYEWRHRRACAIHRPGILWNGQSLSGKTILLHAEQGLGDTIQFVRYLPMVAAKGGRIVLECQPELCRLLGGSTNPSAVMSSDQPPPGFDVRCPLMSLPRIFGTRLDSIPCKIPYLKPAPALVEKWNKTLGPRTNARRVGLVWAGHPGHQFDRNRSMTLPDLAPLASIDGLDFYSLQKGPAAGQALNPPPGMSTIDHTAMLTDLAETAALIANLDLVISVDTAVAHLAGAIGKPLWLLLAFSPDWRWMTERSDSPWYPSMRLFRQPAIRDWKGVMWEVCRELSRSKTGSRNEFVAVTKITKCDHLVRPQG